MNTWLAGAIGFACGWAVVRVVRWIDEAPEGYQDSRGFHYGKQPLPDEEHLEEWAEWEGKR